MNKFTWKGNAIRFVSDRRIVFEDYWDEYGNSVHPSVHHPELYPEDCNTLDEWLDMVKANGSVGVHKWQAVWERFGKQVNE